MNQTVDAQAVVVYDQPKAPATLFGTKNPAELVERATEIANALAPVINKQNLFATISGRQHVKVEGWALLGTMLGVFPVPVWTKQIENGWLARVEARTLDGAVVGAAEAACTRDEVIYKRDSGEEHRWENANDHAICSMAQTRATAKALRLPLGFVITMAGYDTTPAEEMESTKRETPQNAPRASGTRSAAPAPTKAGGYTAAEPDEETLDAAEWAAEQMGGQIIEGEATDLPPQRLCNCGKPRIRRSGEKNGRGWVGWFCQVKKPDGKYVCDPVFEQN